MSGSFTHGMHLEEVEELGRLLQARGDLLRTLAMDVERAVGSTTWAGPDATTFTQQWWPGHRTRLQQVAEQLTGFGQSALNNATEQRDASGVTGTTGGTSGGGTVGGGGGGAGGGSQPGGGYREHFTDGSGWTKDWQRRGQYDQWNFGYDGDGDAKFGNCTSFVAWRLNQLGDAAGHDGYHFDNNKLHLGDGTRYEYGRLGNAYEWYDNAPAALRSSEPAPGSVLVWERGDGMAMRSGEDYGHVAIVKDVRSDGSIVIEESGYDSFTHRERTLPPGSYPKKFLNLLP